MTETTDMVPVCVRIPEETYNYIRWLARQEAILRDRDVNSADLIREALSKTYPIEAEVLGSFEAVSRMREKVENCA